MRLARRGAWNTRSPRFSAANSRRPSFHKLSAHDSAKVLAAAKAFAKKYSPKNADDALPLLEVLWLHQQHNVQNRELLNQMLASPRLAAFRRLWILSVPFSPHT